MYIIYLGNFYFSLPQLHFGSVRHFSRMGRGPSGDHQAFILCMGKCSKGCVCSSSMIIPKGTAVPDVPNTSPGGHAFYLASLPQTFAMFLRRLNMAASYNLCRMALHPISSCFKQNEIKCIVKFSW
jgi:hypothetical protein